MKKSFQAAAEVGPGFRFPSGHWCCYQRAIAHDSWLLWGHALSEQALRSGPLTVEAIRGIARLARLTNNAFKENYTARLHDTPFKVQRWWDPADPQWSHGRRALISIDRLDADDWIHLLPPQDVRAARRSQHVAEILLLRSALSRPA